jgi:SAM-dependent methyltransferase
MAAHEPVGVADAGLISAADAAATARSLAPFLPASLGACFDASFIRSDHLYDEFVARLSLDIVREVGVAHAVRQPGTTDEVTARAGLDASVARVAVDWFLRRLVARGMAAESDGRYRLVSPLPALDAAVVREEQMRHDASWLPAYVLAETVARDYPAFLRGQRAGEEVLFSPARLRLWVEFFSNDNGLYAVNNRVGAVAGEEWLPAGEARILELGGGLGSGAIALLERLEATGRLGDVREYRFTDVVPVFHRRGQQALERRFAGRPFAFGTLDMNRPLGEQGVAPGAYTMIYAVNTLHVARDLDRTLAEVRTALAPGGALVISECVRLQPARPVHAEFVFNLLESFRAPVLHPAYRPNGGFLLPAQWRAAIEAAGFARVRVLPDVERIGGSVPNFSVAAIGATRP